MANEKLGQEPAFPTEFDSQGRTFIKGGTTLEDFEKNTIGMSKRFYAACAAMQGLIAGVRGSGDSLNVGELILTSYWFADELLRQENQ